MTDEEKITLISLVSRIDERLKVVERFVYGFVSVVGGALILAMLALVFRRPGG